MTRLEILEAANTCVNGKREEDYGSPEDSFQVIGDLWNAYLGTNLKPTDVAILMMLMKIGRSKHNGGTIDTYVDIAGYAACGGEIFSLTHSEKEPSK